MKEKLTFQKVCDDVAEDCKRLIRGTVGAAVAFGIMSVMMLVIHILGDGSMPVALMVVMMLFFTVFLCLCILLYYLRMKRARAGNICVVRDIMYRRALVKINRRSHVYVKTLFLKNNGKFSIAHGADDKVYDETECGETVYLVYAGLFPNKILYAYSGGKYEPDFEVRLL